MSDEPPDIEDVRAFVNQASVEELRTVLGLIRDRTGSFDLRVTSLVGVAHYLLGELLARRATRNNPPT